MLPGIGHHTTVSNRANDEISEGKAPEAHSDPGKPETETPPAPNKQSLSGQYSPPFLRLPRELRDAIYEEVLELDRYGIATNNFCFTVADGQASLFQARTGTACALFAVSRVTRAEISLIFAKHVVHTVHISAWTGRADMEPPPDYRFLAEAQARKLRLAFTVQHACGLPPCDLINDSHFRHICAALAEWHKHKE